MSYSFTWCPAPPRFALDWEGLDREFAWVRAMSGSPQEPVYHGEGDVWIHTKMVCEALAANPLWQALPPREREVVFAGALLHDVAKPACTRTEEGRITSRGHSKRGEIMARELLWRLGMPLGMREQAVNLVRYHQVPFFLLDRPDAQRTVFQISQTVRCDHLALVTEADARGRICADQQRLLDNIALFVEYCKEQGCLRRPKQFPSAHSRFLYFRKANRDPDYLAFDDTVCEVVLMSGLPGVGKDYWVAEQIPDRPVISLDGLRREMKISPTGNQGPVVSRARELARQFLRRKEGFVWNATNLSRQVREHCLSLCAAYRARVRIVYLEVPEDRLYAQNRARAESVPPEVIRKLIARWEVPDLTEAHRVDLYDDFEM